MHRPNWTYVRIDDHLPGSHKTDGLSLDLRMHLQGTLVDVWAYCNRYLTDGFVAASRWPELGSSKGRRVMLDRHFADPVPEGYQCHDYLGHQRSRDEVTRLRQAGQRGAHTRWRPNADRTGPSHADRNGPRSGSEAGRPSADRMGWPNADRMGWPNGQAEAEADKGGSSSAAAAPLARSAPTRTGNQPPPISDLCGYCGGRHERADCPIRGPARDEAPRRNEAAAAAARRRWGGAPPPVPERIVQPPAVAERGAALARELLAQARHQPAEDEPPGELPPF